jgi:hypothetical protein
MARPSPSRKVTYFEPVPPRLARNNTIIESTFEVGRRFRCTMRVDCGELDPGAVIRPVAGEWHPRMPERLDDEEPCRLARRPQRGLSTRRPHRRRASLSPTDEPSTNPASMLVARHHPRAPYLVLSLFRSGRRACGHDAILTGLVATPAQNPGRF